MVALFSPHVFLGLAQRRLSRRGVPVFAYHKTGQAPQGTRDPFLYDSPAMLDRQLRQLNQSGFSPGLLEDARAELSNTRRKFVVTFDDGCLSVLKEGLPILLRHRICAIQYLVSAFLGQRNEWDIGKGDSPEQLMDPSQVRAWLAAGQLIGSHSMTHRNLRHLNAAQAKEEISGSKKRLEDMFACPIDHFSYPYGSWNEQVRDLVAQAGYKTASTMDFGVNNSATPAWELRRIFPLSATQLLRKIQHRLARRFRVGR